MEGVSHLSSRLGDLGSVVSSHSGVWGIAPVRNDCGAFYVQFYANLRIF